MGKVPGEKAAWGSLTDHPERRTYDGILVLRLDVPLFWANASEIHDRVLGTVEEYPDTHVVLLDLEATSQLDTTSIDMLELILTRLREREIDLYLVRVFYRARLTLAKAGFIEQLGEDHMWHSISAGVRAARASNHLTAKSHAQAVPWPAQPDDRRGPRSAGRAGRGAHRGRPRRQRAHARGHRRGRATRRATRTPSDSVGGRRAATLVPDLTATARRTRKRPSPSTERPVCTATRFGSASPDASTRASCSGPAVCCSSCPS